MGSPCSVCSLRSSARCFCTFPIACPRRRSAHLPLDGDRSGMECGNQCPSWVIRVVLTVGQPLPVHPDQRTFAGYVGTFQSCHNRTLACSLNYLIGTRDERRRYGKPQLLGCLEIDGQLEFGYLVDRDVAGLCSSENC